MQVPGLELEGFFRGIRAAQNVDGLFVTMPHKSRMLALLDDADPSARRVGAVNVARRETGGRWRGAMFDGYGCVLGMLWLGADPKGRHALLIGAGGAGRAIAFALMEAGVARLVITDQDERRASSLVEDLKSAALTGEVRLGPADAHGFNLIINASPLGMMPDDPSPVDTGRLDAVAAVVDITMGAVPSALLTAAAGRGCRVQDGRAMHEGQAIYAARFFGIDYWPGSRPRIKLPMVPSSLVA
jgi:shikimate dehydrogenase